MKFLICGDVVGKTGRCAISKYLPGLREEFDLDFVVVNGENAAHGFGITDKICKTFFCLGVDAITTGNHVWDKREIITYITNEPRLLRPINFPSGSPGRGFGIFDAPGGKRVLVVNVMGQLFMGPIGDPFVAIEEVLGNYRLGIEVDAIIVDFHCEATSEKQAMGHVLDGRATVVVGTHTHVPTADYQILPKGSGYQTDIGMTGDYDSIIGMKKFAAIERFTNKNSSSEQLLLSKGRLEPAEGDATLCGLFIETNDATGFPKVVFPVRVGGRLSSALPE